MAALSQLVFFIGLFFGYVEHTLSETDEELGVQYIKYPSAVTYAFVGKKTLNQPAAARVCSELFAGSLALINDQGILSDIRQELLQALSTANLTDVWVGGKTNVSGSDVINITADSIGSNGPNCLVLSREDADSDSPDALHLNSTSDCATRELAFFCRTTPQTVVQRKQDEAKFWYQGKLYQPVYNKLASLSVAKQRCRSDYGGSLAPIQTNSAYTFIRNKLDEIERGGVLKNDGKAMWICGRVRTSRGYEVTISSNNFRSGSYCVGLERRYGGRYQMRSRTCYSSTAHFLCVIHDTSGCANGVPTVYYTSWFNSDSPGDTGDWEGIWSHRRSYGSSVCNNVDTVIDAECRYTGNQTLHQNLPNPQKLFCNTNGLICLNKDNQPGGCLNYQVRYKCAVTSHGGVKWFDEGGVRYIVVLGLWQNQRDSQALCRDAYRATLVTIATPDKLDMIAMHLNETLESGSTGDIWIGGQTSEPNYTAIDPGNQTAGVNCITLFSGNEYNLYSTLCDEFQTMMMCELPIESVRAHEYFDSTQYLFALNHSSNYSTAQHYCHVQYGGDVIDRTDVINLYGAAPSLLSGHVIGGVQTFWMKRSSIFSGSREWLRHEELECRGSTTGRRMTYQTVDECLSYCNRQTACVATVISDTSSGYSCYAKVNCDTFEVKKSMTTYTLAAANGCPVINIDRYGSMKIVKKSCDGTSGYVCAAKTGSIFDYYYLRGMCDEEKWVTSVRLPVSEADCEQMEGVWWDGRCVLSLCGSDTRLVHGWRVTSAGECQGYAVEYTTTIPESECFRLRGQGQAVDDFLVKCSLQLCNATAELYMSYVISTQAGCPVDYAVSSIKIEMHAVACRTLTAANASDHSAVEVADSELRNAWQQCGMVLCQVHKDCKTSILGETYRGQLSYAASGAQCTRWDDVTPGVTSRGFPENSSSEAANFCRNPTRWAEGPYCYVNTTGDFETCNIPFCEGFGQQVESTHIAGREFLLVPGQHYAPWAYCQRVYGAQGALLDSLLALPAHAYNARSLLRHWLSDLGASGKVQAGSKILLPARVPTTDRVGRIAESDVANGVLDWNGDKGWCVYLRLPNGSDSLELYAADCQSLQTTNFLCERQQESHENYQVEGGVLIEGVHDLNECTVLCKDACRAVGFNHEELTCWHYTAPEDSRPGRAMPGFTHVQIAPCQCHQYISREEGLVITMSSRLALNETLGWAALLNSSVEGVTHAWIPAPTDAQPWIQVRLRQMHKVYGVTTRGVAGAGGVGGAWVTSYTLSYSGDCSTFRDYDQTFTGNTSPNEKVSHILTRAFNARCVKFHPKTYSTMSALRFDILTCRVSRENIALGKRAYQRSTSQGHGAELAVDGFPYASELWGSCSVTSFSRGVFFVVDLLHVYHVTTVTLLNGRQHGGSWTGYQAQERSYVDTARVWTFVDKQAFAQAGYVHSVTLHARHGDRPLYVGVYRPYAGSTCKYRLVHQTTLTNIRPGLNKITIGKKDGLEFEAGDHFGFSWDRYGTVTYDLATSEPAKYCDKSVKMNVGDIQYMSSDYGKRVYSIMVHSSHLNYTSTLTFKVRVDFSIEVYADGVSVGSHENWKIPVVFTIPASTKILAFRAHNKANYAGVLGSLSNGLVTSRDWRCTTASQYGTTWRKEGFDDSSWTAAVEHGLNKENGNVWKKIPEIPEEAHWIWSSVNNREGYFYCRIGITRLDDGLGDFSVKVGNNFSPTKLEADESNYRQCARVADDLDPGELLKVDCEPEIAGRYVMIKSEKTSAASLTICEIQVYSNKEALEDVALRKPCQQSSRYRDNSWGPELAVDGQPNNLDGALEQGGSCIQTRTELNPWWMVDLEKPYLIEAVSITAIALSSGAGVVLRDLLIYVGDGQLREKMLCTKMAGTFVYGQTKVATCDSVAEGRTVTITKKYNGHLRLCEVQVFASPAYVYTYGGNGERARCVFPLYYNNAMYRKCTTAGRDKPWCAVTDDFSRDGLWGYCMDVRLRDGRHAAEGRVEIQIDDEWETICDDGWNDVTADVVCKQLGYTGGRAAYSPMFPPGHGTALVNDVSCHGNESALRDCAYQLNRHSFCQATEAASVICAAHGGVNVYGQPAFARSLLDHHVNATILVRDAIQVPGVVRSWHLYAITAGVPVLLQVWRRQYNFQSLHYMLVGESSVTPESVGYLKVIGRQHAMHVQPGDVIGLSFTNQNPIPYDHAFYCDKHTKVLYRKQARAEMGSIHTFSEKEDSQFSCRLYSLYAKVEIRNKLVLHEFSVGSHKYQVFLQKVSASYATSVCKSHMGDEASMLNLTSSAETSAVQGALAGMGANGSFWIGNTAHDQGVTSQTADWAPCQPEAGKRCIVISNDNPQGEFLWYTRRCAEKHFIVCQSQTEPVPEEATKTKVKPVTETTMTVEVALHLKPSESHGVLAVVLPIVLVLLLVAVTFTVLFVCRRKRGRGPHWRHGRNRSAVYRKGAGEEEESLDLDTAPATPRESTIYCPSGNKFNNPLYAENEADKLDA